MRDRLDSVEAAMAMMVAQLWAPMVQMPVAELVKPVQPIVYYLKSIEVSKLFEGYISVIRDIIKR